jgi:response regulator RpfG family c-di-GMP phosphodiesterase
MRAERGTHFDPDLIDAFFSSRAEVEAIRGAFADGA